MLPGNPMKCTIRYFHGKNYSKRIVLVLKTSSLKVTSLIFHSCTYYDWTSEGKEGSEESVTLPRNKRFLLKFLSRQNASKCPGLCRHRPGHSLDSEKDKVARNEKRKKLHGFSYYKNIANFEAFLTG